MTNNRVSGYQSKAPWCIHVILDFFGMYGCQRKGAVNVGEHDDLASESLK